MKKNLLLLLAFSTFTVCGQQLKDFKKDESWYNFKGVKTSKLRLNDFVKNYKTELELEVIDELLTKRTEKDQTGITHITYQHFIDNIEVEGSELIVHSDNTGTFAEVTTDKLSKKISKQLPVISEQQALTTAIRILGNKKYAWLDSLSEAEIKEETKNPLATNFPHGKLIYTKQKLKAKEARNYRLCYKFIIKAVDPLFIRAIYIDANNGTLFKEVDLLIPCDEPATATTLYNGNQTIITDWRGFPTYNYRLYDCNRNIHTKYGYGLNPEATNGSTWWGTNDQSATSGHWAAEMTWDLYRNVYGRNGTNNSGREIKLLVDFSDLTDNAYYDFSGGGNDKVRVGRTSVGNRSLSTLDIIGHEITHGLTLATANLAYENESGALNESFSDIFGFMVERRAQGGVFDWRIGEDAFVERGGLRDIQNPNLYNQPEQFGGTFWYIGPDDFGGVHTNSGVQNRWFFILSNGGFQNGVNVSGIGIDNAALIAWRTLLFYLGQFSNYNDARNGSINAAIALFGVCSNEVIQVTNAWAAVGVGAAANLNCITLDPSSIHICYDDPNAWTQFPITITANFTPANGNITWDVPADFNFSISPSGDQVTINSGPLTPDVFLAISATLTSGVGNPVTATTWYSTYQCYGSNIMRVNKSKNVQEKNLPSTNKAEGVLEKSTSSTHTIYPNPARSFINLRLSNRSMVKIIDLNGRIWLQQMYNPGLNRINTEKISNGMYILQVTENGKNTVHKVQINH